MLYRHYRMTDPDPNLSDIDIAPNTGTRPALPGRRPDETDRHPAPPPRPSGEPDHRCEPGGPGFDPPAAGPVVGAEAAALSRLGFAAIVLDPQWLADLIERVTTPTTSVHDQDR